MGFLQDVRFAARSLARRPVLTCAVAITLLIGIGLNAAVFAALDGMWFRARVEKDPHSFVQILSDYPGGPPNHGEPWTSSLTGYAAMRSQSRTVTDFAAWRVIQARVEDDSRFELSLLVTCDFFSLYGLDRANQGRLFASSDCVQSNSRVAVISEELWRSRFYSASIIGTHIRLNQQPYLVVGVAPAQFPGRLRGPGIWIPYTAQPDFYAGRNFFEEASSPWLTVEGRMRPGYSRRDVEEEMTRISAGIAGTPRIVVTNGSFAEHPGARGMMLGIVPLVMAVMTLVLLMACSNVTILLLARAAARRQEIAIRRALGADRTRLLRMLATEGLLIAVFSGAAAAVLAHWLPVAFRAILWRAPYYPVHADWKTFAYLAGITLLSGCLAGLAPAVESFRSDLSPALKKQPSFVGPRSRWQMRDLQVAALVAIGVVLVTGATLFVRAQWALVSVGAGEQTARTLVVALRSGQTESFAREVEARIRRVPGVESATTSKIDPGSRELGALRESRYRWLTVRVDGNVELASREISAVLSEMDPQQMAMPHTVQSQMNEMAARFGTLTSMVAALGLIALVLAITGVYGIVAFSVSQRSKELAIRVALGGRRGDILRSVLSAGFRPIGAGLVLGVVLAAAAAVALSFAFRSAPVPIHAGDPIAYLIVCALLATASLIAMFRPAWRAGSIDPGSALRED